MKRVSGFVFKFWRYVLECCGLWLCDSSDKVRSNKLNMAGMWPWVPKKLLKWEKAKKNILLHSKLILSIFWWKGYFFDSTSAELSSLRHTYGIQLRTSNPIYFTKMASSTRQCILKHVSWHCAWIDIWNKLSTCHLLEYFTKRKYLQLMKWCLRQPIA